MHLIQDKNVMMIGLYGKIINILLTEELNE